MKGSEWYVFRAAGPTLALVSCTEVLMTYLPDSTLTHGNYYSKRPYTYRALSAGRQGLRPRMDTSMTTSSTPDTPTGQVGQWKRPVGSSRPRRYTFVPLEQDNFHVPSDSSRKSKHLVFDIGVTALITGGLIAGSMTLSHISHGVTKDLSSQFLFSLSIGFPTIALFALIERFAPAGPHKSINGWVLNLRIAILGYFGATLTSILGASAAAALAHRFPLGWIDLRFAGGRGVQALIAALLLTLFISDFFYYWSHRFQHKVAFLWQQHKLHHMDEQMNASTAGRIDWLKYLVKIPIVTIPTTVIFKLDPVAAGTIGGVIGFATYAWVVSIHSNIKLHLGMASVLAVGPQVHRIHHSRLLEHRDRNFAGNFPIWDLLFGTYYHPGRDEFPPTGVVEEPEVQSFLEAVSLPYRGWWKMFREWRHRNAVSV
jgi:sterol desaturase/sphingolipid hydroxylase (fatty acid hydroxylase superfamily)